MEARCQCGSVAFKTPLAKPLALYICHCAECRRQTSSAFGTSAIFPRFPMPASELLSCYKTQGKNVVSVKGGCIEGLDWTGAIHIWTKSAMIPIPEGTESYSGEPSESDYCASQESLDQPPDVAGMLVGSGGWPSASESGEDVTKPVRGACELSGP
ncbi:hypothetical protein Hte_012538 [Hypoxylon texense]